MVDTFPLLPPPFPNPPNRLSANLYLVFFSVGISLDGMISLVCFWFFLVFLADFENEKEVKKRKAYGIEMEH